MSERFDIRMGDRFASRHGAQQHLAAIVEWSDDAILTKDLNGIITSWNRGATRLFGYTPEEAIGRPVTMLIPEERHDEEPGILARIRRGDPVDHYETIRRRKDGTRVHISLTVSPLRDAQGTIVGASKIARDISERHRAQEQQQLLLAEMQHRIKNVFAVANGLIGLCARRAKTPTEVAEMAQNRLQALSQAYSLTVPTFDDAGTMTPGATVWGLLRTLLAPALGDDLGRVSFLGEDVSLSPQAVTPLALVLNELVTNATKHGALRGDQGEIAVDCRRENGGVVLRWEEHAANALAGSPAHAGFGTHLSQITVEHQLGGRITRDWTDSGLSVTIAFGAEHLVEG